MQVDGGEEPRFGRVAARGVRVGEDRVELAERLALRGAQGGGRVGHLHVSGRWVQLDGQLLAQHHGRPLGHGLPDKAVPIGGGAAHGAKQHPRPRLPRVERQAGHGHIGRTMLGKHRHVGKQGEKGEVHLEKLLAASGSSCSFEGA